MISHNKHITYKLFLGHNLWNVKYNEKACLKFHIRGDMLPIGIHRVLMLIIDFIQMQEI